MQRNFRFCLFNVGLLNFSFCKREPESLTYPSTFPGMVFPCRVESALLAVQIERECCLVSAPLQTRPRPVHARPRLAPTGLLASCISGTRREYQRNKTALPLSAVTVRAAGLGGPGARPSSGCVRRSGPGQGCNLLGYANLQQKKTSAALPFPSLDVLGAAGRPNTAWFLSASHTSCGFRWPWVVVVRRRGL